MLVGCVAESWGVVEVCREVVGVTGMVQGERVAIVSVGCDKGRKLHGQRFVLMRHLFSPNRFSDPLDQAGLSNHSRSFVL